jgi:hypothetical protein
MAIGRGHDWSVCPEVKSTVNIEIDSQLKHAIVKAELYVWREDIVVECSSLKKALNITMHTTAVLKLSPPCTESARTSDLGTNMMASRCFNPPFGALRQTHVAAAHWFLKLANQTLLELSGLVLATTYTATLIPRCLVILPHWNPSHWFSWNSHPRKLANLIE